MTDLFISYSRDDRTFVERLHAAVEQSGRNAWLDKFDIEKGEKFWREIEQGIDGANAFVFVISPTSIEKAAGEKEYCRREIEYAVRQGKRIIPIVLPDLFKPSEEVEDRLSKDILAHRELRERNWLDFYEHKFESNFAELLETVDKDLEYVKLHTQFLEYAQDWMNGGRKDSNLLRGEILSKAENWLQTGQEKARLQRQEHWRKYRDPEPTPEQETFIDQSRFAEDARLKQETLIKSAMLWGGGILAVSLVGAGIASWRASSAIQATYKAQEIQKEAQEGTRLERDSRNAVEQFQKSQTEGLLSAMRAASELRSIVKDGRSLDQYPTVTPIYTLQTILDQVQEIRVQGDSPKLHPSGKLMVTLDRQNNALKLYDLQGEELGTLKMPGSVSAINNFHFSRNGEILAVSFTETPKTVIWRLPTSGQDFSNLQSQDLSGESTIFDAKNENLATYEEGQGIRIWNLAGAEIAKISTNGLYVMKNSISFPADGKFIAARLSNQSDKARKTENEILKIWDYSGKEISIITSGKGIGKFLLSKDAQKVVTLEQSENDINSTVKLWDSLSKRNITLESNRVVSIFLSPDNEKIVVTSSGSGMLAKNQEAAITVWNWDGKKLATLKGHQAAIQNVVFSRDAQKIATSSYDGTIKIWNLNGQELATLIGDTLEPEGGNQLSSIAFNSSSDAVAVANLDGVTRLWNLQGREISRLKILPRSSSITFANNDASILVSDFSTTGVWNIDHQSSPLINPQHGVISQTEYSPDGKMLMISGENESIQLWTLSGQKVTELKGYRAIFSPNGKLLAAARANGEIQIWNLDEQKLMKFQAHQSQVYNLKFSPDGKTLATNSEGDATTIWDMSVTPPKKKVTLGEPGWNELDFTPDGSKLLIENRSRISLWNLDGQLFSQMTDNSPKDSGYKDLQNIFSPLNAVFSPDGQKIAGNANDGTLRLWNLSGQEILKFSEHISAGIMFSPNGKVLASSTLKLDERVTLWNLSGEKINKIDSKKEIVGGRAFSPDSQMIATNGSDTLSQSSPSSFQVWDLSGRLVSQFDSNASFSTISPDWKNVASIFKKPGETNQSVRIRKMRTMDELIQSGCNKLKVFLLNKQGTSADRKMCGLE
jgi:WD40 repeat protein